RPTATRSSRPRRTARRASGRRIPSRPPDASYPRRPHPLRTPPSSLLPPPLLSHPSPAMNSAPLRSSVLAAGLLLGSAAQVQPPGRAPPWWGVSDAQTVSLYYTFAGPTPFQPTFQVHGGAWYNPAVTQFTVPPNLAVLPTFAGHTGVVALQGT